MKREAKIKTETKQNYFHELKGRADYNENAKQQNNNERQKQNVSINLWYNHKIVRVQETAPQQEIKENR